MKQGLGRTGLQHGGGGVGGWGRGLGGDREPGCTWENRGQSEARSCCNSCGRSLGLAWGRPCFPPLVSCPGPPPPCHVPLAGRSAFLTSLVSAWHPGGAGGAHIPSSSARCLSPTVCPLARGLLRLSWGTMFPFLDCPFRPLAHVLVLATIPGAHPPLLARRASSRPRQSRGSRREVAPTSNLEWPGGSQDTSKASGT